jgi:hypothetical protein
VKEKRKGPISIAGGLVDSVAATVRRMQRDREPRALAYDPTGYARLIQPEARGHARILEIAEAMVAQAGTDSAARSAKDSAEEKPAGEVKGGRAKPSTPRVSRRANAKAAKRSADATPRNQRARRSGPEKV